MAYEISKDLARKIRAEFMRVLDGAVPAYELKQLGLFDNEAERFIGNRVDRKLYEPELPCGGPTERTIVEKLERYKRKWDDPDWRGHGLAWRAINAWKNVCPSAGRKDGSGYYYIRRPFTLKTNGDDYKWLHTVLEAARQQKKFEDVWFAELMRKGLPERVADFQMETLFLLEKPDGEVERLVRLRNVMGEHTEIIALKASAFHAPQKFREWCLQRGNYDWGAGEKELQKLQLDVSRSVAWRKVQQVVACGWRPIKKSGALRAMEEPGESRAKRGMWFFDDCVIVEGKMLVPDENGICWFEEEGYLLSERGIESEFFQKRPKMYPRIKWDGVKGKMVRLGRGRAVPDPGGEQEQESSSRARGEKGHTELEYETLGEFFHDLCKNLYETLGGFEGFLFVGAMLAYAAAPEVYDAYGQFPGLWVHGQGSSGKTTLCGLMMGMWGFDLQKGLGLVKNTSAVGMLIAATQYSNLPVWLDEFRQAEVEGDKLAILRSAFNREEQAKWSADGKQRKTSTAFLVSGETTTHDYATRSRYPHIQVSASRRLENHLDWFKGHARYFFLFTRHVLERREEFAELMLKQLKGWCESNVNDGVQERDKLVYGVAYASWCVAAHMMESHSPQELGEFRRFLLTASRNVSEDIQTELNINLFWQDLITAFRAEGAMPTGCFRVEYETVTHAPDRPNQTVGKDLEAGWQSWTLFMEPESVIRNLEIYLAKARGSVTLKRKDLRDQLSVMPYWIPGKLRKRFWSKGDATSSAWGIKLDKHPLGYLPVTDEEYAVAKLNNFTEGDPRKGDLYAIVEAVERARRDAIGGRTD